MELRGKDIHCFYIFVREGFTIVHVWASRFNFFIYNTRYITHTSTIDTNIKRAQPANYIRTTFSLVPLGIFVKPQAPSDPGTQTPQRRNTARLSISKVTFLTSLAKPVHKIDFGKSLYSLFFKKVCYCVWIENLGRVGRARARPHYLGWGSACCCLNLCICSLHTTFCFYFSQATGKSRLDS